MVSLRNSILNSYSSLAQNLRDQDIDRRGQAIPMKLVISETEDAYGHREITMSDPESIPLLINWEAYRILLEFSDASSEETVPLTALAKIKDDIPIGSVATIDMQVNTDGVIQTKDFVVSKNEILANIKPHSRRLTLVPDRGARY